MNEAISTAALAPRVWDSQFYRDVLTGFSAEQKHLSPKYFYDEQGSAFFDEICHLDEYYPYRTELTLLPTVAEDLANHFKGPVSIVEFGAGSLVKVRPLLDALSQVEEFVPIDISGEHLRASCRRLQREYPKVLVRPVTADFCKRVTLPAPVGRRLGFFPGSTIGNFNPVQAVQFLSSARQSLGAGGAMLVGVDTKKSAGILHRAYNDSRGVTARFNLNLLHRINRELDAGIPASEFEHYAFYNAREGRVEMHLIAASDCACRLDDARIEFHAGESIHTENSYKYTPQEFSELAARAGWKVSKRWLAKDALFGMYMLEHA